MPKEQEKKDGSKLKRKKYEKELRRLQAELCYLQDWAKEKGARIMVVFEVATEPVRAARFGLSPNG
ncbi:MAG: hypothetical protein R3B95_12015 [Nitrospirales bacterium]|nr:hypothetical protein [Nitrospirales bacterium]